MNETTTVAQFGCGYWGPNLLRNFSAVKNCWVGYVVEQSAERRGFVEANYPKTKAVADVQAVWNDPEVKAVVVATPAAIHFDLAKQALQCGEQVLVFDQRNHHPGGLPRGLLRYGPGRLHDLPSPDRSPDHAVRWGSELVTR